MTEGFTPEDTTPADFSEAFDEWIAGATVSKRSVPIYGKPGLYAEYEDLERQLEKAQQLGEEQQEMAGSEIGRIQRRMEEIYHEWVDSKSTWVVRALNEDEVERIRKQEPELVEPVEPTKPKAPEALPDRPSDRQARAHTVAQQRYEQELVEYETKRAAYEKELGEFSAEMNLRGIAAAVERIEFANGRVADGVTVEQVRQMKEKLGTRQITSLVTAAQLAAWSEPEIPAPFSRSSSKDDQTSS